VITKVLFGAAIALGVAVGLATPAGADPSLFGTLSCSCEPTGSDGGAAVADQIDVGLQSGLANLQGLPATGNAAPLRAVPRDHSSG
jgi:hypothetical protein